MGLTVGSARRRSGAQGGGRHPWAGRGGGPEGWRAGAKVDARWVGVLGDHRVAGRVGAPAAAHVEMAHAGWRRTPQGAEAAAAAHVHDAHFVAPLAAQQEHGGMAHDCPVYGGSSGSPLLMACTAELVGVHTCFDHGKFEAQAVTLEAIRSLL